MPAVCVGCGRRTPNHVRDKSGAETPACSVACYNAARRVAGECALVHQITDSERRTAQPLPPAQRAALALEPSTVPVLAYVPERPRTSLIATGTNDPAIYLRARREPDGTLVVDGFDNYTTPGHTWRAALVRAVPVRTAPAVVHAVPPVPAPAPSPQPTPALALSAPIGVLYRAREHTAGACGHVGNLEWAGTADHGPASFCSEKCAARLLRQPVCIVTNIGGALLADARATHDSQWLRLPAESPLLRVYAHHPHTRPADAALISVDLAHAAAACFAARAAPLPLQPIAARTKLTSRVVEAATPERLREAEDRVAAGQRAADAAAARAAVISQATARAAETASMLKKQYKGAKLMVRLERRAADGDRRGAERARAQAKIDYRAAKKALSAAKEAAAAAANEADSARATLATAARTLANLRSQQPAADSDDSDSSADSSADYQPASPLLPASSAAPAERAPDSDSSSSSDDDQPAPSPLASTARPWFVPRTPRAMRMSGDNRDDSSSSSDDDDDDVFAPSPSEAKSSGMLLSPSDISFDALFPPLTGSPEPRPAPSRMSSGSSSLRRVSLPSDKRMLDEAPQPPAKLALVDPLHSVPARALAAAARLASAPAGLAVDALYANADSAVSTYVLDWTGKATDAELAAFSVQLVQSHFDAQVLAMLAQRPNVWTATLSSGKSFVRGLYDATAGIGARSSAATIRNAQASQAQTIRSLVAEMPAAQRQELHDYARERHNGTVANMVRLFMDADR
jgi:hypothetical protein